ncbi:MAG: hypothetical protein ACI4E1_12775 [Lachnospira sp.]
MVFNEYTKTKKTDIKGWLSGSNSKVYLIILLLLAVTLIFVLQTLIGMRDSNDSNNDEAGKASNMKESGVTDAYDNNLDVNNKDSNNDNNFNKIIPGEKLYVIKVSLSDNFAIIYKNNGFDEYTEVIKAFPVSVCENVKPAVTKIESKTIWKHIGYSLHGHYITRMENGEYFSAVACYNQNTETLNKRQYEDLGSPSNVEGSVYMPAGYAKWIYENCSNGVEIQFLSEFSLPKEISLDVIPELGDLNYDPTEKTVN